DLLAQQQEAQANADAALEAITSAENVDDAIKLAEAAISAPMVTAIVEQPTEAIDAAEILDDVPSPATAEMAGGTGEIAVDQLEGSGGNILPDLARDGNGGIAGAPDIGSASDQPVSVAGEQDDALTTTPSADIVTGAESGAQQ